MKIFKNNIYKALMLLSVIVLFGCDEGFDEININPNAPTVETVQADNLFLAALVSAANETMDETLLIISDLRGFAFPSGIAAYENGTSQKWSGMYDRITDINTVLGLTTPGGRQENTLNNAVARILRVLYYQRMVDLFGAIPYTEGAKGLEFPNPSYDSEAFIYKDLVNELDQAITQLNAVSGGAFSNVDFIYDGSTANWIKFANALKLRIGMRMRFVDPAVATPVITNALSSSLIGSNSESATFKYPGSEDSDSNPLHGTTRPTNRFVSELLLKELRDSNDPRKFIYATVAGNNNDIYQGQVNGLNVNFDDGAQSVRGTLFWQNRDLPAYILTYSEVCFLRAEAALAGIGGGDANAEFRKGIRANLEQWGVSETDIATFLTTSTATLSGSDEEKLEQIAIQKWIALFTNGHEAYAEMRRTGYPAIAQRTATAEIDRVDPNGNTATITVGYRLGITEGVFPTKVEYPSNELNLNTEHYNTAVSAYGDGLLDNVWWDVR